MSTTSARNTLRIAVAQLNPLYQLVELVRGACFGFETVDLLRFGGLVIFSLVLWRVACRFMQRRLII